MLFYLVRVRAGRPPEPYELDDDGKPVLYSNGDEAARIAATIMPSPRYNTPEYIADYIKTYGRIQPRPFPTNDDWRARETARFADGTYTALPWESDAWWQDNAAIHADHFAHVSAEEPGKLAFTESPERGAADRQVRMRPGRYLERYFSGVLSGEDIKKIAAAFAARFEGNELKFADTAEAIREVYENGPSSCMSQTAGNYASAPFHPAEVYAAGDLAVAYFETAEGDITARALCWPTKKIYGRIYGDADRLSYLLDLAGYAAVDSYKEFNGARIAKIECDDGYVMPYIDGYSYITDAGTHFVLSDGGAVYCANTNGATEMGTTCGHCGRHVDEDDTTYIENVDECWCQRCTDRNAFYCEGYEQHYSSAHADSVELDDGRIVSEDFFHNRDGATCEVTGRHFIDGDGYVILADGRVWALDYAQEHGHEDEDGEWHAGPKPEGDTGADETEGETPAVAPAPVQDVVPGTRPHGRFLSGDVVRAIDAHVPFPLRAELTVTSVSECGQYLRFNGMAHGWSGEHFVLVSRPCPIRYVFAA